MPDSVQITGNELKVLKVDDTVNTTFVCEATNTIGNHRDVVTPLVRGQLKDTQHNTHRHNITMLHVYKGCWWTCVHSSKKRLQCKLAFSCTYVSHWVSVRKFSIIISPLIWKGNISEVKWKTRPILSCSPSKLACMWKYFSSSGPIITHATCFLLCSALVSSPGIFLVSLHTSHELTHIACAEGVSSRARGSGCSVLGVYVCVTLSESVCASVCFRVPPFNFFLSLSRCVLLRMHGTFLSACTQ